MKRFAHAVYCDDIRQEVGNKISLIGIYHGKLFVTQFPVVLPKLAIAFWARTPAQNPFRKFNVRLLIGEKVVINAPFMEDFLTAQVPISAPDDSEKVHMIHTSLIISPLPLDGPTTIKLRIDTEAEELRAGGLDIELAAATTAATSTGKTTLESAPAAPT